MDATLIAAPSSTKNKGKQRDPEMHSSKKGNQWYFGVKAHIGVDVDSGLDHALRGTSGHVGDVTEGHAWVGRGRKPSSLPMLATKAPKNVLTPSQACAGM